MKYRLGLLLMLTFIMFSAISQTDSATATSMIVHKDNRIDLLLKKQASVNNTNAKSSYYKTSGGHYKGYRIMVLNSNDRELVYKVKGQLLSRFPEQSVYMSYQAPFFRLKMGDFIKREDAEDFTRRLAYIAPRGVFVVPDIVKLRPEDEKKYLREGENKNN